MAVCCHTACCVKTQRHDNVVRIEGVTVLSVVVMTMIAALSVSIHSPRVCCETCCHAHVVCVERTQWLLRPLYGLSCAKVVSSVADMIDCFLSREAQSQCDRGHPSG